MKDIDLFDLYLEMNKFCVLWYDNEMVGNFRLQCRLVLPVLKIGCFLSNSSCLK